MAIVTIIGAGMMGSALAFPARENGNEVRIVGTHLDREIIENAKKTNRHLKFDRDFPGGIKFYPVEEMEEAIAGSTFIIGGVSSFGVDWFCENVLPKVPQEMPVLSVTKGLINKEDGRLICYPEYWEEELAKKGLKRNINAIGGPCTSYELVAHDHSVVCFCGHDMNTLKMLKKTMETPYYHISLSTNVRGIESAVALKNGYALGIALTIGLNKKQMGDDTLHFNSQAGVFGQGAKELTKLLSYQGVDSLDDAMVGIGDLYVTVYGGRTRLVGILLGEGDTIEEAKEKLKGVTLESLVVADRVAKAIKVAIQNGKANAKDYPLLLHIDGILNQHKDANLPWEDFTFMED